MSENTVKPTIGTQLKESKYCVDGHLYVHASTSLLAAQRKAKLILEDLARVHRFPTSEDDCEIVVVNLETKETTKFKALFKVECNMQEIESGNG